MTYQPGSPSGRNSGVRPAGGAVVLSRFVRRTILASCGVFHQQAGRDRGGKRAVVPIGQRDPAVFPLDDGPGRFYQRAVMKRVNPHPSSDA